MKFDLYGMIEMEHTSYPGSIGDSCAETFRYYHLLNFVCGEDTETELIVRRIYLEIKTDKGYLRHPTAPMGWREDDFSGDQALPLLICLGACKQYGPVKEVIERNNWKYGNGDFVHPSYRAAVARANGKTSLFWDSFIYAQALSMKHFPYRWNDGAKTVERVENSSCDFINFIHLILQAEKVGHTYFSRKAKEVFTADFIMKKVVEYYAPEPRNSFLVELYDDAVRKTFSMNNPQIGPLFNPKPLLL